MVGRGGQSMELASVKARIRLLCARTVERGCTDAEAMTAAGMVGCLLEQYALTMDEVEAREGACEQRTLPCLRPASGVDGCLVAIAAFCGCRVWRTGRGAARAHEMFGFPDDVALACYLHAVVERAMVNELAAWRAGPGAHLAGQAMRLGSMSFRHGMSTRVSSRLGTMQAERERSLQEAASRLHGHARSACGSSLVVMRQASVDAAFQALGMRLRKNRACRVRRDRDAYHHGKAAGGRVELGRPLSGDAAVAGRIAA